MFVLFINSFATIICASVLPPIKDSTSSNTLKQITSFTTQQHHHVSCGNEYNRYLDIKSKSNEELLDTFLAISEFETQDLQLKFTEYLREMIRLQTGRELIVTISTKFIHRINLLNEMVDAINMNSISVDKFLEKMLAICACIKNEDVEIGKFCKVICHRIQLKERDIAQQLCQKITSLLVLLLSGYFDNVNNFYSICGWLSVGCKKHSSSTEDNKHNVIKILEQVIRNMKIVFTSCGDDCYSGFCSTEVNPIVGEIIRYNVNIDKNTLNGTQSTMFSPSRIHNAKVEFTEANKPIVATIAHELMHLLQNIEMVISGKIVGANEIAKNTVAEKVYNTIDNAEDNQNCKKHTSNVEVAAMYGLFENHNQQMFSDILSENNILIDHYLNKKYTQDKKVQVIDNNNVKDLKVRFYHVSTKLSNDQNKVNDKEKYFRELVVTHNTRHRQILNVYCDAIQEEK